MNLVTAIIVETAMDTSNQEKIIEKKLKFEAFKKQIPFIRELFKEMDTDNSGTVTLDELFSLDDDLQQGLQTKLCV